MAPSCPYRQILGDEFDALPAIVQRAHTAPLSAEGSADVWRGPGLGGLLAWLCRLPRSGLGQKLELELAPEGAAVRWSRAFDGHPMSTRQWAAEGILYEQAGCVRIAFAMHPEDGCLRYESGAVWVCGVPLPRWARPRTVARVTPEGRWWNVEVRVDHPVAGLLCMYRGTLEPR